MTHYIQEQADPLYFAYGSNMCLQRLQVRAPSARLIAQGRLRQHSLRFHKESVDGSAKCDAYFTGKENDVVYGALLALNAMDRAALDICEGLGKGYEMKEVLIEHNRGTSPAYMYYATRINADLKPYDWYKRLVLCGALQHGLPETYIDCIRQIESIPDPDQVRHDMNMALLISTGHIRDD